MRCIESDGCNRYFSQIGSDCFQQVSKSTWKLIGAFSNWYPMGKGPWKVHEVNFEVGFEVRREVEFEVD